jgi:ABC-2 type transport system ATP-binding protein
VSGSPPAIEAERLGRDYGDTRALDALDLVVQSAQVLGLLGPNGAGKTTTMLLLATLLTPTRGVARIFGQDVTRERRAVRRRLGLVFQENTVDALLTVSENLLFAARLAGLGGRAAREAVAGGIEWAGLGDRAATPARQLSGGWRRIVDLVRALLHQPDLLILDEPTVGLDPEHRERVWSLLESRRRDHGTTILFSTHYLAEAEPADRVVLLSMGRVVASDSPAAVKATIGVEVAEIEGPGADPASSITASRSPLSPTRKPRSVRPVVWAAPRPHRALASRSAPGPSISATSTPMVDLSAAGESLATTRPMERSTTPSAGSASAK